MVMCSLSKLFQVQVDESPLIIEIKLSLIIIFNNNTIELLLFLLQLIFIIKLLRHSRE